MFTICVCPIWKYTCVCVYCVCMYVCICMHTYSHPPQNTVSRKRVHENTVRHNRSTQIKVLQQRRTFKNLDTGLQMFDVVRGAPRKTAVAVRGTRGKMCGRECVLHVKEV